MMDPRAEAIADVYRARYGGFRRAVAAVIGDYEAAHDVVQDGFARALVERGRYRGGSLEAWVWRIVVRRAFDVRQERGLRPLEETVDPALVASDRDPELAAAIRELSPRRRLIVFLRYFADLPYADIAHVCGISEGTVAAALAQAHDELRQALQLEGVGR